MINTNSLIHRSIRYRFLFSLLPACFITACLFLGLLTAFQLQKQADNRRQLAQEKVTNLALLLAEPVWQLSSALSVNILDSSLQAPDVECISLQQDSQITPLIERGNCQHLTPLEAFSQAITYTSNNTERTLGKVTLYIHIEKDWTAISRQIIPLIILSLILFVLILVISLMAFRRTILAPLAKVSRSLEHYQRSGQRVPVDWQTNDELGLLIQAYNASLQRQQHSENLLEGARQQAEQALQELRHAQQSLIQAEKMASLGNLVAGIAHEVNTPLGNSLTLATSISAATTHIEKAIAGPGLRRSTLLDYVSTVKEASVILERNLHNAVEQVRHFKQVAVDQTSEKRRRFDLESTLNEVVSTLTPQIKHSDYQLVLKVEAGISMHSYPGPLGQIVTNCFNNALLHGFADRTIGVISINAYRKNADQVRLEIADNGRGMTQQQLKKAFDPFFTTRLGQGGSGLGLNLVYNLATSIMGGDVSIVSQLEQGTTLVFTFPLTAPAQPRNPDDTTAT